jgi:hypothetical protein
MKLYVNGCSFSHGHRDFKIKDGVSDISPDWAWPMLLKQHFNEVVSEAFRGSSNHRIIRRSMEYLDNINDPENWTVVIQFANIERQEYYDKNLSSWIGHIVDDPCIDDRVGQIGNEYLYTKLEYKTFKNYCTLVNNDTSILTDLVLQIMAFQGFCKIKGFKNVYFTGQSYQTMITYYLENKILDGLANNIDTSNFLIPISHITRGHEESATDGHPNEVGHELFARYIINEIQK